MKDNSSRVSLIQFIFVAIAICLGFIINYLLRLNSYYIPLGLLCIGLSFSIIYSGKIALGESFNNASIISGITAKVIATILLICGVFFIVFR